ncbi:MAG TPA: YoaK family protein [Parvibaculum sp.]
MTRHDRRTQILAACLSALAGYVDALAFIKLGGFFVSFMSGNSTRLAVGLAEGSAHALVAGAIIASFVLGVALGTLTGQAAKERRRPAVLALVAALLAAAAALSAADMTGAAIFAMALAMGAENAVFEREGEVSIGLTYMTGTLVKLGQRIVSALLGGDRFAWLPYLLLWMGLVLGAAIGATVYLHIGMNGLWVAAGAAAALAIAAARMTQLD